MINDTTISNNSISLHNYYEYTYILFNSLFSFYLFKIRYLFLSKLTA